MKHLKMSFGIAFLLVNMLAQGGGIVTNTNQSAAWVRMFARDASRDLDAVYYNPAGLTALKKGLYFSLNNQSLFSTRRIKNNYYPLEYKGYTGTGTLSPGGSYKGYVGNVSAPVFPGIYAAYSTSKFVFSFGFNPVGGGGNAVYNSGLPSFELAVSDLVPSLSSFGVTGYNSEVYFKGSSVFYGYQAGVSYKVNDMISVFAGGRYVHAVNRYQGYLKNNEVIVGGTSIQASTFLTGSVVPVLNGYKTTFSSYPSAVPVPNSIADQIGLAHGKTFGDAVNFLTAKITNVNAEATLLSDQEADVTQTGSGFTPILGANLTLMENKLNIGLKYEFITKQTLTNKTDKDITTGYSSNGTPITQFPDGAKTASDMPALFTLGASYKLLEKLSISGGFHYYFDKNANYGRSQNSIVVENSAIIDHNNYELAFGSEYNLTDKILVSAGYLYTKTGVMVGYNTDLSYSLNSNSFGLGGKFILSPRFDLDLGLSYTEYIPSYKTYEHTMPTTIPKTVSLKEKYYKDVLIFAVGLNIKLSKTE